MLARPNRLKREEITRIVKTGRRLGGGFYRLSALKLSERTPSRFAVVVSSKTAPRAVDRNLLKRRTRAIIRANVNRLTFSWGVVVFVGPRAKEVSFSDLTKDLTNLLSQL